MMDEQDLQGMEERLQLWWRHQIRVWKVRLHHTSVGHSGPRGQTAASRSLEAAMGNNGLGALTQMVGVQLMLGLVESRVKWGLQQA